MAAHTGVPRLDTGSREIHRAREQHEEILREVARIAEIVRSTHDVRGNAVLRNAADSERFGVLAQPASRLDDLRY